MGAVKVSGFSFVRGRKQQCCWCFQLRIQRITIPTDRHIMDIGNLSDKSPLACSRLTGADNVSLRACVPPLTVVFFVVALVQSPADKLFTQALPDL